MSKHTDQYRFEPQPDITAQELAEVVRVLLIDYALPGDEYDGLPENVKKHFTECLPDEFE